MRLVATTVCAVASAVAFGFLTGGVAAGVERAGPASARWHAPTQLDVLRDRLKRTGNVPAARPPSLRWRSPAAAGEVGVRPNTWRRSVSRPRAATTQSEPASVSSDYDGAVLAAINALRSRHGLAPLRQNERLEAAADSHSRSMGRRGFFAHESADGSAFWKRVQQFYPQGGFAFWAVGENLIYGSPSLGVDDAIRGWLESPGHRANMLSKEWREVGVASVHLDSAPGIYGGRPVVIVTTDFGARR